MTDNLIELNAGTPTVESVINRLYRYQDRIKDITVVVEWEEGGTSVAHNEKKNSLLCYDAMVLQNYVNGIISGRGEDE